MGVRLVAEPEVATSLAEHPVIPQRVSDLADRRDEVLKDPAGLPALQAHVHVLARVLGDTICANVPAERTRRKESCGESKVVDDGAPRE
jgi:hypothetical protein